MSLILDALRKIEQERKARRQGSGDIRSDVLSYRAATPPPARSRLVPLLGLGLVLLAAVGGLSLWRESTPPGTRGQRPDSAGQLQTSAQLPPSAPAPTALQPPPPAPLQQPAAPAPAAPAAPAPRAALKPAPLPMAPAGHTESGAGTDSGNLVVSGIAWQEERGLRRAVVNGSLVGEGAEILGARIVEIRENRVRFSRGGSSFDVSYGGAGR